MLTVGSTFQRTGFSAGARRVATAPDLITATAISGLIRQLIDLAAQRLGVCRCGGCIDPTKTAGGNGRPLLPDVQRALRTLDEADYLHAVDAALALGVTAVKVAPFDAVDREAKEDVQLSQAGAGFARLECAPEGVPANCHCGLTATSASRPPPRSRSCRDSRGCGSHGWRNRVGRAGVG